MNLTFTHSVLSALDNPTPYVFAALLAALLAIAVQLASLNVKKTLITLVTGFLGFFVASVLATSVVGTLDRDRLTEQVQTVYGASVVETPPLLIDGSDIDVTDTNGRPTRCTVTPDAAPGRTHILMCDAEPARR